MGTTPRQSRWLRQAFAPTVVKLDEQQLDGLRARHADEIRQTLAEGGDQHVDDLLQQANKSYLEQDRRA